MTECQQCGAEAFVVYQGYDLCATCCAEALDLNSVGLGFASGANVFDDLQPTETNE